MIADEEAYVKKMLWVAWHVGVWGAGFFVMGALLDLYRQEWGWLVFDIAFLLFSLNNIRWSARTWKTEFGGASPR